MGETMLYMIPSSIGPEDTKDSFSPDYLAVVFGIRRFIVEQERTARRFLSKIGHPGPIKELEFRQLNKHTSVEELEDLASFIQEGEVTGLLSEAGCPGIADPGADLVDLIQKRGIKVVPLIGPCSIVLGLMASGLNGQNFTFHGYLPRDSAQRNQHIRALEQDSRKFRRTQICIETPYRNRVLFEAFLKNLSPETRLCLACELTDPKGWVITKSASEWRKQKPGPDIQKKNVVFLFLAN